MAGGIMQLVAYGAASEYLMGNPDFSYFRLVYRRHTNFSMESITLAFNSKPTLDYLTSGSFVCNIGRNADLVKELYLTVSLPAIYSNDVFRFQWIQNIGNVMIKKAYVTVDTTTIDTQYGQWMDIWNELTIDASKRPTYDRMIANIQEFTNPKALADIAIITNNQLTYSYYPVGSAGSPSIPNQTFYIPLNFWFTRNSGLALPLIALQYQKVNLTLELRPIRELYQVFDSTLAKYISPTYYLQRTGIDASIGQFLSPDSSTVGTTTIDLNGYVEANYVYLDTAERTLLAKQDRIDYLVEQLYTTTEGGILGSYIMDLPLHNPTKELIWVTQRSDVNNYNDWTNYTNRHSYNRNYPILKSAKILFNGFDRFEEKPAAYFNLLQPFQHHTNSPREGIYVYSFALHPEKSAPSGTCNMSMLQKTQLYVTTNAIDTTDVNPKYEYEVTVYSLSYNIFRVMSGSGSMVFAN